MAAMPVLMAMADIEIKKGIASAIGKWDGHISLPSFLMMSDSLVNGLGNWLGTGIMPKSANTSTK